VKRCKILMFIWTRQINSVSSGGVWTRCRMYMDHGLSMDLDRGLSMDLDHGLSMDLDHGTWSWLYTDTWIMVQSIYNPWSGPCTMDLMHGLYMDLSLEHVAWKLRNEHWVDRGSGRTGSKLSVVVGCVENKDIKQKLCFSSLINCFVFVI